MCALWWVQALNFWNRTASVPNSRVLHHFFRENIELAAKKKNCWSGRLLAFLGGLDALLGSLTNLSNTGVPANIPAVNCEQI
jgi:hypothetical protein